MNNIYYFAYGSNMLHKVIASRRGIKYLSKSVGAVKGWQLLFNCPGVNKYEPAFANIQQSENSFVYGVLYAMQSSEFEKLVKTEGDMYKVVQLAVQTSQGLIQGNTLVSKNTVAGKNPSLRYLTLMLEGAKENALDVTYVKQLESTKTEPTPPGYTLVSKLVAVYLRIRFFLQKRLSR